MLVGILISDSSPANLFNERNSMDNRIASVTVENIHKRFGNNEVLCGISFTAYQGDVISVLGPSGSGKSTLLNIIGILDEADSGEYTLDGVEIKNLTEKKAAIYRNKFLGFIFQSFNLITYKNAVENVALPLYYQGLKRKERIEKALFHLGKVGLVDWAKHLPNELSGGQKQRLGIARALAMDPVLMLLDEPTSALDPELVSEVLNVLKRLANEGMTMIIVTHELGFASQVADRVAFMEDGKIIEEGPPNVILKSPKTKRLRLFLDKLNITSFTQS